MSLMQQNIAHFIKYRKTYSRQNVYRDSEPGSGVKHNTGLHPHPACSSSTWVYSDLGLLQQNLIKVILLLPSVMYNPRSTASYASSKSKVMLL